MAVTLAPHLWYAHDAEAAARFYAAIIPNSSVDRVSYIPTDTPSGPAGSVAVVEFTLAGASVMAISAGEHDPFNDAISLVLICDTQAEIDRLWDGLLQGGGTPIQCGWLKDRFGVSWQVTPRCLGVMMCDTDRKRAGQVAAAMMQMVKFDIAALQAAYHRKPGRT